MRLRLAYVRTERNYRVAALLKISLEFKQIIALYLGTWIYVRLHHQFRLNCKIAIKTAQTISSPCFYPYYLLAIVFFCEYETFENMQKRRLTHMYVMLDIFI